MTDERRDNERVRLQLEARWAGLSGQHGARVYDLSQSGCYIETLGQVGAGERVVFQIKLPEVRDRFAPEFTHYESEITRVVKEEVAKVHE